MRYHSGLDVVSKSFDMPRVFPINYNKALYKTNIHFWKKDFSGLMFFKKNKEDKETRVVFMSELGLKYFDFKLTDAGVFSVEYILDELNKESLILVLEKDIRILLQNGNNREHVKFFRTSNEGEYVERSKTKRKRYYYFFNKDNQSVTHIDYTGSVFKKIKIDIVNNKDLMPENINIKHLGIRLRLTLRLIK